MSGSKSKGPIVDPGLCRCCGAMKKCRLLNEEYEFFGQTEVYSDMFVDCFGLLLSHLDGEPSERLICATCVVRLREARAFRAQVLECEQKLLHTNIKVHNAVEVDHKPKIEVQVKEEEALSDSNYSMHDDAHSADESADKIEPIVIKIEPVKDSEKNPEVSRRRIRKRVSNQSREDYLGANKEMLLKLQKMTHKLNKMQDFNQYDQQKLDSRIQKAKRTIAVDKDLNALRNAVTIVENSYVSPFLNTFSDYLCAYCREMFLDPIKLREHILTHDPKTYNDIIDNKKLIQIDVTRIDCRLCEAHIDNIDSLKTHITNVHNKFLYSDVSTELMKFKLKCGTLTCMECDKTFSFFHALKKHMAEHFGTFICDVCGAHYFEERHLYVHKNRHNNAPVQLYSCDQCDKSFRSKNSMNFHIARIHKNEATFPCNRCDEIFISYHKRYRHKMSVHGEKRSFPCESCTKVFDSRKSLRQHNQKCHLQLLRHQCTLCDKKFYIPSALKDHMTSHTGERNFRCEFCGKNYPRSKALKVHLESHSSEKKYKCSLCPRAYTQATNFKNHMKTKHPPQVSEGYS